jgi:hypothetical protein
VGRCRYRHFRSPTVRGVGFEFIVLALLAKDARALARPINQCDGCRCGWPIDPVYKFHRDPNGRNHIGCTAHLYAKARS